MSVRQKGIIDLAMSFVRDKDIAGDYMEFGLYQGKTFFHAFHASTNRGLRNMRFWGFDSFRGLPESDGEQTEIDGFTKGRFACSLTDFEARLERAGVERSRVELVEGWWNNSLTDKVRQGMQKAAVVMVDCDLYQSALLVLEFVTPLLQDGTVLIFDDWLAFNGNPGEGEQRACREWLEVHAEITLADYHTVGRHGKSFVVHLRS